MPIIVAPILIEALGLLLCLLLFAMSQAGQTFFRSLFTVLRGIAGSLPIVGSHLVSAVDKLIARVVDPISHAAYAMERPAVDFFNAVAAVLEEWAFTGYYTATRTLAALYALRHGTIPHLIRAATLPVTITGHAAARALPASAKALVATIPRLWRYARSVESTAVHALSIAARASGQAVAGTVPRALPWVGKEVNGAEATAQRAIRGIKDVRNLLAAGVLGGLIIKALTRAGVGNIRCGNLKRYNRHVCGMPSDWLDSLLLDSLLIIGTISLVEYARHLESITEEASSIIHGFIREA